MKSMNTPTFQCENLVACEQFNVLILGDSRSGKSTFVNQLQDRYYKTKMDVYRGTIQPMSKLLYCNFQNQPVCIRIIDTPGFNELSTTGANRTDRELRDLIVNFAKNDITFVNLIVFTINGSGGLTQEIIDNIQETQYYFGSKLAAASCLLITHFDNRSEEQENQFVAQLKENKKMEGLLKITKSRILFTGALDESLYENEGIKAEFLKLQDKRHNRFLQTTIEAPKISFKYSGFGEITPFDVLESAKNTYFNLATLPRRVELLEKECILYREKLRELLTRSSITEEHKLRIETALKKTNFVGTDAFNLIKLSGETRKLIEEYDSIENSLKKDSQRMSTQHDVLEKCYQQLKSLTQLMSMLVIQEPEQSIAQLADDNDSFNTIVNDVADLEL